MKVVQFEKKWQRSEGRLVNAKGTYFYLGKRIRGIEERFFILIKRLTGYRCFISLNTQECNIRISINVKFKFAQELDLKNK